MGLRAAGRSTRGVKKVIIAVPDEKEEILAEATWSARYLNILQCSGSKESF